MKKLDVSSITDVSQMPLKKGTLEFLQQSYAEIVSSTIISLVGPGYDPTIVYVLYGVGNTGSGSTYGITSGAVFYNGEVFMVDSAAFTVSGSDTAVFTEVQTQYTIDADPVTFTDSAVRNIHNIRKIQVSAGASGSGLANYGQAFRLSFSIPAQLNLSKIIDGPFADNILQIFGAYPDLQLYVPTPATSANPILKAGSYNVGDLSGLSVGFTITFADVGTANYYVMGTVISNGNPTDDTTVMWSIRNRTNTSFVVQFREISTGPTQNIAFEYILFKK